jgi:hypothetical protein
MTEANSASPHVQRRVQQGGPTAIAVSPHRVLAQVACLPPKAPSESSSDLAKNLTGFAAAAECPYFG